ncbi:MAG TPA: TetR/AcrR family transcriptional regulator [Solirubrobacteraceae bacterium]|nr:TetR/AcrR family transcriptional regulator [Solirubrobacteraceae bacterium]
MHAVATSPRKLQTAEDRREDVMRAAMREFARRGYYGTPTTDVARGAGISQAYLFRLFPTKEELFVACVERTYRTVHDEFVKVSAPHAGDQEAVMTAMGDRYNELLQTSDVLLCQLHGYAACREPAIRTAVREGYQQLVELVQHLSGAPDEEIQRFFAIGMLINVVAAMGAQGLDEPWLQALMTGKDC